MDGAASSSLDKKKDKCNDASTKRRLVCGEWTASGVIERNGERVYAYAQIPCRRWTCDYCGPRMKWRLRERITAAVVEKRLSRLMTLTLDPKKFGDEMPKPKVIWGVWRKFRVSLRRRFEKSLSYVAVLELQKSGMPHLHVLVSEFIAQEWISKAWDAVGGGPIADIRAVRSAKEAGRYVVKYLAKGFTSARLRGVRRYSSSRNIQLREEMKGKGWKCLKRGVEVFFRVAGDRAVEKVQDKEGRVTFFTVKGLSLHELRLR